MMKSISSLLAFALCCLATVATAFSRNDKRFTPSSGKKYSLPLAGKIKRVAPNQAASANWIGYAAINHTWTTVETTFTVPDISTSSPYGSALAMWVGIDGATCKRAILQTGLFLQDDGTIEAFYEWFPRPAQQYKNFVVSKGDSVRLVVTATSSTSGIAMIENKTTGKTARHSFSGKEVTASLCRVDAEWIVEAYLNNGTQVELAYFGELGFQNSSASDNRGGTIIPSRSNTFIMMEDSTQSDAITGAPEIGGNPGDINFYYGEQVQGHI